MVTSSSGRQGSSGPALHRWWDRTVAFTSSGCHICGCVGALVALLLTWQTIRTATWPRDAMIALGVLIVYGAVAAGYQRASVAFRRPRTPRIYGETPHDPGPGRFVYLSEVTVNDYLRTYEDGDREYELKKSSSTSLKDATVGFTAPGATAKANRGGSVTEETEQRLVDTLESRYVRLRDYMRAKGILHHLTVGSDLKNLRPRTFWEIPTIEVSGKIVTDDEAELFGISHERVEFHAKLDVASIRDKRFLKDVQAGGKMSVWLVGRIGGGNTVNVRDDGHLDITVDEVLVILR